MTKITKLFIPILCLASFVGIQNPTSDFAATYHADESNEQNDVVISPLIEDILKNKNSLNVFFPEHGLRDEQGNVIHKGDAVSSYKNKKIDGAKYQYCGDCCIITYNDVQILVDCGSGTYNSSPSSDAVHAAGDVVLHMMNDLVQNEEPCENGKKVWDYCIFTHGHADHIDSANHIFDYSHKNKTDCSFYIKNVIDFSKEDGTYDEALKKTCESYINSITNYKNDYKDDFHVISYRSLIEDEDTSKRVIKLGDNANAPTLNFLYCDAPESAAEPNDSSISFLLTYKKQKLLFTGDLEDKGEESLRAHNYDLLKDGVTFYKAAHHGSSTSNSLSFIDLIRPCYVVIPTVANTKQYHWNATEDNIKLFPSVDTLDNIFKYTDYIYIPSHAIEAQGETGYESLYGDIFLSFDGSEVDVKTTNSEMINNDGSIVPIFQTEWFAKYRDPSYSIYTLTDSSKMGFHYNCSLYKFGHYDVLIDCGSSNQSSLELVKKVKHYVVDGVIECVIVTHAHSANISQLVGTFAKNAPKNDGVFDSFKILKLIDFGKDTNMKETSDYPIYSAYCAKRKKLIENNTEYKELNNKTVDYVLCVAKDKNLANSELTITCSDISKSSGTSENDYSIITSIKFFGTKSLFCGDIETYSVLKNNSDASEVIKDSYYLKPSNANVNKEIDRSFLTMVKPKCTIISTLTNNADMNYGGTDYTESCINNTENKNAYSVGYLSSDKQKNKETDYCFVYRPLDNQGIVYNVKNYDTMSSENDFFKNYSEMKLATRITQ